MPITPINGLELYKWRNPSIIVSDLSIDSQWPELIQEAVLLWGANGTLALTYKKPTKASRGIIVKQVAETRSETSISPNRQLLIDAATIYIAPYSQYLIQHPDDPIWWMRRTIRHEMAHGLGFSHGGIHLDHFTEPGPVQHVGCCLGSGNQVFGDLDFPILAQRYV